MTRGYMPNTDQGLLGWSANLSQKISASPESYGLSSERAAQYAAAHANFAAAMTACDPGIKSKVSTAAKNELRETLKTMARAIVNIIEGQPSVTDPEKISLGLTVRSSPKRIPPPDSRPSVQVVEARGFGVTIKLRDSGSSTFRGIPPTVSGATVFTYVGDQPPTDARDWKFECNTSRSKLLVNFPSSNPPGTKVWFAAVWFNGRHETGPVSSPICTNLPGGSVAMAA